MSLSISWQLFKQEIRTIQIEFCLSLSLSLIHFLSLSLSVFLSKQLYPLAACRLLLKWSRICIQIQGAVGNMHEVSSHAGLLICRLSS